MAAATNFPEFNAAVTELTTKVSTLLGDVATMQSVANVQVAVDKAAEASASATEAAASEAAAANSATAAAASEASAETANTAAQAAKTAAESSNTAAATSATNAAASATNAAASATTASTKATEASASATTATTKASEASTSATSAATSSTKAGQWADANENIAVETGKYSAKHHAIKAGASAASAAGSASAASASATSASGSADSAASSAGSASQSATDAAASAGVATTKAGESASSASTAEQHSLAAQQAADAVAAIGAGWTPVIANVSDGERIVMQVTDWTGGEANKPTVGQYVGPSGFVTDIAQATDVRGAAGSGAVESVSGILPDANGNVQLNAADVGALPESGTAADSSMLGGKPPSHYESSPLGFRLFKEQPNAPAWAKSGGSLITAQALTYTLDGAAHELPGGTIISLPAPTAGNDYAIYATTDGRLVADLNWSAPSGEPAGTTRKIGGFHVALTGEIFEYSLWDINYRPTCPDPRGMVCINGMFWADIYLLGVNHHIDGTSRAGVTIADGVSPPKIPTIYGGDGSTAYGSLTWFETQDVLQSHGKRCPSWAEFSMLAFGVTEGTSVGQDPVTTKHDAPRRSRWGVEQATGNMLVWGADVQGNAGGGWEAITGGRGSVYHSGATALLLGADWDDGANSGSRAAGWYNSPSFFFSTIGGRGLSDHLCLLAER